MGIIGVYFLLSHVINNASENFFGFIGGYLGAILMGYLYVVIKVWIGSHLALKKKPDPRESQKCLNNFFVDIMTA